MPLDLDHLLRLRLAVARFGEMDAAQWWNTKGVLGRLGAMAWPRNFPRTHAFARARTVFTVVPSGTFCPVQPYGYLSLGYQHPRGSPRETRLSMPSFSVVHLVADVGMSPV